MADKRHNYCRIRQILLGSVATVPVLVTAAYAQGTNSTVQAPAAGAALPNATQAAAPTGPAAGQSQVGEVVVTARKRTERLIDVPAAITALSTKQLARYSTTSIESVGTQIPQVAFTQNPSGNGANINIRGVGSNTSADDGIEQAVSVNYDGVPTARGRILQSGLFDLNDVQVLKGPQALYFGKNSPGGAIVIDSKGPTSTWQGYARGGYEFTAHDFNGEGAIGGPITDTLGVRVAISGSDMLQGYVQDVAQPISNANDPIGYDRTHGLSIPGRPYTWGPEAKQGAARVTLRWTPISTFDATLKFLYSYYRDNGDASQNVIASCTPGVSKVATTDLSNIFVTGAPKNAVDPNSTCNTRSRTNTIGELPPAILAGLPFNRGDSEFTLDNSYISSLVMNYKPGWAIFTSVTGFYKYANLGNSFFDDNTLSLAGGGANSYSTSYSEEIRGVTQSKGPFNFTGGLFYGDDHREYKTWSMIVRGVDPATGLSTTSDSDQFTNGTTMSAFGELTWKITPDLELAGGARFTHEKKIGNLENNYVSPEGALLHLAAPAGLLIPLHLTNNNTSPQVTLTWHPAPNTTIYGGYRTGFLAGTFSNPGLVSAALIPTATKQSSAIIQPETTEGYEGGLKFEAWERRFSGDVAIYHYVYRNLQVSAFDSVTNTVLTTNAGGSQVDGIEGNFNYAVTPALALRGAAGYNRARYTTFLNAACYGGQTVAQGCVNNQQNLTGQPLPRAPEWSANAGVTYDRPLRDNLLIGATVDARYTSAYNFVATNNPFAIQRDYATLDASLRLHDSADHWELALIARNLTDTYYFTIGSERPLGQSPGSIQGVPGLPRTVLLQGTYNF